MDLLKGYPLHVNVMNAKYLKRYHRTLLLHQRERWQRNIQRDHTQMCPMKWRLVEEQAEHCAVFRHS